MFKRIKKYFETMGFKKGKNTTDWFQSDFYLQHNVDVRAAGMDPLEHYMKYGWKEKRLPNNWFDPSVYEELYPNGNLHSIKPLINYFSEFNQTNTIGNEFYATYYQDLKNIKNKQEALSHWKKYEEPEIRTVNLQAFCRDISFPFQNLPDLNIDVFQKLNPLLTKVNFTEAIFIILQINGLELVRITEDKSNDACFYLKLAEYYLIKSESDKAYKLLLYSIYLKPTVRAYELTGNYFLDRNNYKKAIIFYEKAVEINERDLVVVFFVNLSKAFTQEMKYDEAISSLILGLQHYPINNHLLKLLDSTIDIKWQQQQETLQALVAVNDRRQLIEAIESIVKFNAKTYADVYGIPLGQNNFDDIYLSKKTLLNERKVLIIGDYHIPQCIRYRIDQKAEQLRYANYDVTTISWTEMGKYFDELYFNDIIIYYRVPAFPIIVKSIEKAKSLGKITFYEIDDLIFSEVYPAPYEEYGGNITLEEYNGLIYGMPLFRMAATLCEFAIASTLPLLDRLESLVLSKKGFLHRNGLDKKNVTLKIEKDEFINIFYGSGTLAHNSDFIELVLSPIEEILRENSNVKLNIVGYLNLPESFLETFPKQVNIFPKTGTIEDYWTCLSQADINLAVLKPNPITDTKSELKWFEAAYFEIPSVVSNTQNYLDILENGEDALIAETQEDWYEALNKLIKNRQLRKDMGKKAFRKVQEEYSVKNLSMNIHTIIQTALTEKAGK